MGAGEDQTASSAMQMADEYLAKAMTAHGGLGLARMISSSLDQAAANASNHNTSGQTTSAQTARPDPAKRPVPRNRGWLREPRRRPNGVRCPAARGHGCPSCAPARLSDGNSLLTKPLPQVFSTTSSRRR